MFGHTFKNRKEAQKALAELLCYWTTDTAYERLENEARDSKKSINEVSLRVAGNLLNSLTTHRS